MPARLLAHTELLAQLTDLPGWETVGDALHARYDCPDVPAAVTLVAEAFDAAEQMDHHPDTDVRWKRVRFRLSTHDAGGVTQLDVELAHRLAAAATAVRATTLAAEPVFVEIGVDTMDPSRVAAFWRAALAYRDLPGSGGTVLVDPHGLGPRLWFQQTTSPAAGRNRLHLDTTVGTLEEAERRGREVLAAGGRLVTDEFAPAWTVYADADDNEVCVCTQFGRE